jgi:hypothetical protein
VLYLNRKSGAMSLGLANTKTENVSITNLYKISMSQLIIFYDINTKIINNYFLKKVNLNPQPAGVG